MAKTDTTSNEQTATDAEKPVYVNAKLSPKQAFVLDQVTDLRGEKQIDYVTRVVVEALRRDADPDAIRQAMEQKLAQLADF